MTAATTAYDTLKTRFAAVQNLRNAQAILNRDMITVMPSGAAADRAAQLVALAAAAHEKMTAPDMPELLDRAAPDHPADQANLAEMKRLHAHAAAVPADMVAAAARLGATGDQNHAAWRQAGDWAAVRGHYDAVFTLQREIGAAKQAALGTATAYDALIDEYDPGGHAVRIAALFAPVEAFLKDAVPAAAARHAARPAQTPSVALPAQEGIFRAVAAAFGFDFTRGAFFMIDQHPSCYGTPDDQRFTARARPDDFPDTLRTVAHEVGHGLYEQNLPRAWRGQPGGLAAGMTIHESQALFWEKQIAGHPGFATYLAPMTRAAFGTADVFGPPVVAPGLIRVAADEMTYPLHIFLRFDLEQRLMAGTLNAADLPEAWNEGMRDRLGIVPPHDGLGCLQDIHWAGGAIGYFPSYALGAMVAAQLMAALRRAVPDVDARIARGDFAPVLQWLTTHVHNHGSLLAPDAIVAAATGAPPDPAFFIAHLRERYLA